MILVHNCKFEDEIDFHVSMKLFLLRKIYIALVFNVIVMNLRRCLTPLLPLFIQEATHYLSVHLIPKCPKMIDVFEKALIVSHPTMVMNGTGELYNTRVNFSFSKIHLNCKLR